MSNLEQRTEDAYNQLVRYGGVPCREEIVEIIEILSDINDDLYHDRDFSLTVENIEKINLRLSCILMEVYD